MKRIHRAIKVISCRVFASCLSFESNTYLTQVSQISKHNLVITSMYKKTNIHEGETHCQFSLITGHAVIAVCYLLLKVFEVMPELCQEGLMYDAVEVSVIKLAKLIEKHEGYLPDIVEWGGARVHLCQSTGCLIPLFLTASGVFRKHQQYLLDKAIVVGDLVWQDGIKMKTGGFAENGYLMNCLYRHFKKLSTLTKNYES